MQEISVGVDSHRSTLAAAAIDPIDRVIDTIEVVNDPEGHRRFIGWRRQLDGEVKIGIESSGSLCHREKHCFSTQTRHVASYA